MKKLLCVVVAVLFLLSVAPAAHTSATVNYCAQFEDAINILRWNAPYWDIAEGESFPLASIIHYTKQKLCVDAYGEEPIGEGQYRYYSRYAIPADIFEAAAMDFFAVVDINALRSFTSFFWDFNNFTGIDDFQNYQEDRHVYLFSNYGSSDDPSRYEVLGYAEEDGVFRVYARFLSLVWGVPDSVAQEDYVYIDGFAFRVDYYLETVLSISNGRVKFHAWKEIDRIPDVTITPPLSVLVQNKTITIEATPDAFPADTVIQVNTPDEETLQATSAALSQLVRSFVAFDIVASAQPNGTVQVTFAIPQDFDFGKLALFHIADDGTVQQLDAVINADNGTITAQLQHFSLYAVAELADPLPQLGDVNGDGKINTRDARLILCYVAGLVSEEELLLSVADMDGDGVVDTRDARLLLRHIAGLE